ncbi:MAG: RelA/SpoT family protein [Alphaproteobacteria bacterium]|nr:RelA/SpoT family protein [Alphaproteobacteria bacterium]
MELNINSDNQQLKDEDKIIVAQYKILLKNLKDKLKGSDKKLVKHALKLAIEAHKDMRRKSGEPYILHPIAVANICVEEIGLGVRSSICALLHDTVEDTELTIEDIQREFGNEIAKIVDGLTKISNVSDSSKSDQVESFKKILLALMIDPRVILIKLADRVHNMRTLEFMKREKQLKIASETTWIYAPIAHRLGLYNIKTELEDLSMKYLEPQIYKDIALKLNITKKARTSFINEFIKPIQKKLDDNGFNNITIYGRPKSIFSIWNKIKNKNVPFEEIYDLFAIKIIIENAESRIEEVANCWRVFSIIRAMYASIPNRLRDWLSEPKSNGYEALHATVMSHDGKWVEIQIKSQRMEAIAEKGVAAHFKYKNTSSQADSNVNFENWYNEIKEALFKADTDSLEFVENVQESLIVNEIYIYTPHGDIKKLPYGSTVVDFSFALHSKIGLACIGAKVNHKLVALDTKLHNGDQVEILTSSKLHPSKEWLNFVVTKKAKQDILDYLGKVQKVQAQQGKIILDNFLTKLGLKSYNHNYQIITSFFNKPSFKELCIAILEKSVSIYSIETLPREQHKLIVQYEETWKKILNVEHIKLLGEANIHYTLADCCNPIYGDEIFALSLEKSNLTIHRINCPNAPKLLSIYGNKIVKTKWVDNSEISFLIGIGLKGIDAVGLIHRITDIISNKLKINISSFLLETERSVFQGYIKFFVKSKSELENLIKELKEIKEIEKIERLVI